MALIAEIAAASESQCLRIQFRMPICLITQKKGVKHGIESPSRESKIWIQHIGYCPKVGELGNMLSCNVAYG